MNRRQFAARELEDVHRSGPLASRHRGTFATNGGAWIGALLFISLTAVSFSALSAWISVLMGGLGLALAAWALGDLLQTIELHRTHLIWRKWGNTRRIAYENIRDVRAGVRGAGRHTSGDLFLDLQLDAGETLTFTAMSRHNELSRHLAEIVGALAPAASGVTPALARDGAAEPESARARRVPERSGFVAWLMQPHVLGFWGLVLLALGVGSAVLVYDASAPPAFAQLDRYEGTVAQVFGRRVQHLERTGYQARLDGWMVRLQDGAEFFVGTPASFDDASSLSSARTDAALPVGARVVIHTEGARVWQLTSGSSRVIDYAEMCDEVNGGNAQTVLLALVSLVLGSVMCWSAVKRFWRDSADAG